MENDLLITVLPSILGLCAALLGSIVSYAVIKHKMRIELMSHFRRELRSERIAAYRKFWEALAPLALYAPPDDLTLDTLKELEHHLSEQYFLQGLFLSKESRNRYFLLQDAIQRIIMARSKAVNAKPLRTRDERFTLTEAWSREIRLGLATVPESGTNKAIDRGQQEVTDEKIEKIVAAWESSDLEHADFHLLRALGSRLRTRLAYDLEARVDIWAGFTRSPL